MNAVSRTNDDVAIVQQVQELLKKYGSLTGLNEDGGGKFSRTNDRLSFRSPRKDSKPENHLSRIPAPVSYKA